MTSSIISDFKYERFFESPKDQNFFHGYFGQSQVSRDNSKLLCLKVEDIDKIPDATSNAIVGWFDLDKRDEIFHEIGETNSFNWQQGAMLQFIGPDFNQKVLWNSYKDGNYKSIIYDLDTNESYEIPAVYDVDNSGLLATSIDFIRHTWCRRGYSYGNIFDECKNKRVVENDSIDLIELKTGKKEKVICIEDLLQINPIDTMQEATHYMEHMQFNPAGDRFVFLHRWKYPSGIHSRLYSCKVDGSDLKIICDSGRMSHYTWLDNTRLFAYGAVPNSINQLRKKRKLVKSLFRFALPIYKKLVSDSSRVSKILTGDSYLILDTETGNAKKVLSALSSEDGHPVSIPNTSLVITDTYARSFKGEKPKLIIADTETGDYKYIDQLESISEYDETPLRCDLHPCISFDSTVVSIDCMDSGVRSVYAYKRVYSS